MNDESLVRVMSPSCGTPPLPPPPPQPLHSNHSCSLEIFDVEAVGVAGNEFLQLRGGKHLQPIRIDDRLEAPDEGGSLLADLNAHPEISHPMHVADPGSERKREIQLHPRRGKGNPVTSEEKKGKSIYIRGEKWKSIYIRGEKSEIHFNPFKSVVVVVVNSMC